MNRTIFAALALTVALATPALAQNQNSAGGTPDVLPRPDFHFPGNVGRTYLDSDPPQFPQPVQAPKGAPNVVLILVDDAGFGQFSTFGTTALCSPTRAALITGRNHHAAAFGVIAETATGYDGYTAVLPRSTGTV